MIGKAVFSQKIVPKDGRIYLSILTEKEHQTYLDYLPLADSMKKIGAFNKKKILDEATGEDTLTYCICHKETGSYMGYCSYQGLCSEEPHIGVELIEPFRGQGPRIRPGGCRCAGR